jgi:hypothetical protein
MLVSLISMFLCDLFSKKGNIKWLDGFALSISMIPGMDAAVTIFFARILFTKTHWLDRKGKEV